MGRPTVLYNYICESCKSKFVKTGLKKRRNGKHIFCCLRCSADWKSVFHKGKKFNNALAEKCQKKGKEASHWKRGYWITAQGYKAIMVDRKYYLEHRYIMEQNLGRKLSPEEHIHHINGIKTDNRLENLELMKDINKFIEKYG